MAEETYHGLPYRPCVGAALFNKDGKVWVGKRAFKQEKKLHNFWQMPQGGIELGEEPDVAVKRELREETGVDQVRIIAETRNWFKYDLPENMVGKSWGGKYRGQEQKWYALEFLGDDKNFCLDLHSDPEFSQWMWVDIEGVVDLVVEFKREVYKAVVRQFRNIPENLRKK